MYFLGLLWVVLPLIVAGCAGLGGLGGKPHTYSETFQSPFDVVWDATIKMFEARQVELEKIDKGQGKIITQWLYREGEKSMGVRRVPWEERHRLTLRIKDKGRVTEVSAYAIVEEKGPGGTQAYRWTRMESTGDLERDVLDSIGEAVELLTGKGVK